MPISPIPKYVVLEAYDVRSDGPSQVQLYAEYEPARLIDFLRASNYYSLESAYKICLEKDLVPEMVFLLGRMGNNKKALNLIIERLGDVSRAIDFAKEQNDDDLWEDLLRYSETRPGEYDTTSLCILSLLFDYGSFYTRTAGERWCRD